VTEHLVVVPHPEVAREIADELREEGFTSVQVVRMALAGEDDAEDVEWGVHIVEENIVDEAGAVEHGLRDRFEALAAEHHGWYDPEPEG
jgi:hypothetical protein